MVGLVVILFKKNRGKSDGRVIWKDFVVLFIFFIGFFLNFL